MFMIRKVGTELYNCEINEKVAITVAPDDDEYKPTKYNTIEEAQNCIDTLCKDIKWQIVVV